MTSNHSIVLYGCKMKTESSWAMPFGNILYLPPSSKEKGFGRELDEGYLKWTDYS